VNTKQFYILKNLINNWLGQGEAEYQPTQEELAALRWFLYESDQGETERAELIKQAARVGMEPGELVELRRLADQWIY
jgi:hypothetical protein